MAIIYIIFFLVLVLIGMPFATPALFPRLRRRARESHILRWTLIYLSGFVLFIAIFLAVTSFTARINNGLSAPTYPSGYFSSKVQNAQLTRELWIHYVVPPMILSDTTCFNSDPVICDAAEEVLGLSDDSLVDYLFMIFIAIIPALSCALMVRYITRDDRKVKPKS